MDQQSLKERRERLGLGPAVKSEGYAFHEAQRDEVMRRLRAARIVDEQRARKNKRASVAFSAGIVAGAAMTIGAILLPVFAIYGVVTGALR